MDLLKSINGEFLLDIGFVFFREHQFKKRFKFVFQFFMLQVRVENMQFWTFLEFLKRI